MEVFEGDEHEPWGAYGFALAHKHLPEMRQFSGRSAAQCDCCERCHL